VLFPLLVQKKKDWKIVEGFSIEFLVFGELVDTYLGEIRNYYLVTVSIVFLFINCLKRSYNLSKFMLQLTTSGIIFTHHPLPRSLKQQHRGSHRNVQRFRLSLHWNNDRNIGLCRDCRGNALGFITQNNPSRSA
jgi:hypothetical protein